MDLTAPEVARLLGVREKLVYRWADDGEIPSYRVQGHLHFHPAELLEWATLRQIAIAPSLFADSDTDKPSPDLASAIAAGGALRAVEGHDMASVWRSVVELLSLPAHADRALLFEMLLASASMGVTIVGHTIAVPHVRSPIVIPGSPPLVAVFYLQQPLMLNDQLITTLCVIVAPTVRVHLQLLAKLNAALHDSCFKAAVEQRGDTEALVAAARRVGPRPRRSTGAHLP